MAVQAADGHRGEATRRAGWPGVRGFAPGNSAARGSQTVMGAGVATNPHCPASSASPRRDRHSGPAGFRPKSCDFGRALRVPDEALLPRRLPLPGSLQSLATSLGSRSRYHHPKDPVSLDFLRKVGSACASRFFLGSPCTSLFHKHSSLRMSATSVGGNDLKLSSVSDFRPSR